MRRTTARGAWARWRSKHEARSDARCQRRWRRRGLGPNGRRLRWRGGGWGWLKREVEPRTPRHMWMHAGRVCSCRHCILVQIECASKSILETRASISHLPCLDASERKRELLKGRLIWTCACGSSQRGASSLSHPRGTRSCRSLNLLDVNRHC